MKSTPCSMTNLKQIKNNNGRLILRKTLLVCFVVLTCLSFNTFKTYADQIEYKYDSLNRLIEVRYLDKVIHYTYDPAGNRTGETVDYIGSVPTLASLSPGNITANGGGLTLTVNGANFVSGAAVLWNGVARPTTFINATKLTAVLGGGDIALPSTVSVTVVNPAPSGGTSNALSFDILAPAPDLTLTKSHAGQLAVGSNAGYTLSVTNVGSGNTTGTVTVMDTLPNGLAYVSAGGTGWACSAAGQDVTCTNTNPLAAGSSSSVSLTVAVGAAAASGVINTALVSTPDDSNPANNTASDNASVSSYSISGHVVDRSGNGVSNVLMTLTGGQTATTDGTGNYAFAALAPSASYTVTPSLTGFGFSPANRTFTGLGANQTANFTATPALIISEFRLRGPGGQYDEFVELYNNTDQDILVTDASPVTCAAQTSLTPPFMQCGWAVMDVQGSLSNTPRFVVPAGTTIPARGHYLAAGTGYSLSASVAPDQTYDPPLYDGGEADFTGLALFRTADRSQFSQANVLDSVGFGSIGLPFREGAGLQPPTGITSDVEHSFVRNQGSGRPADTDVNANDFILVATDPASLSGVAAVLGAPGPENRTGPVQRNSGFSVAVPPGVTSSVRRTSPPVPNGDLGTLSLRRRFTNNTGQTVTRLRFRVTDLTTLNSKQVFASQAEVRVLDATLVGLSATGLKPTTVEQTPIQSKGGGVNSSLLVSGVLTLSQPLQAGQSVDVEFLLGVMKGGSYQFVITVDAAP
jgi:uncharacterized repeat protein (TIGR01451 family)